MQAFLEYVVKGLVDHPDAVTVTPVERNGITVYQLRMDPKDVARVIGRQGTTINAIRSLLLVEVPKRVNGAWRRLSRINPTKATSPRNRRPKNRQPASPSGQHTGDVMRGSPGYGEAQKPGGSGRQGA